jgi:multidrug efflux pump
MTSAATVFGHFPLMLVSGPGAEARNSIGTVLVAGMTVGTLFTLFVVPVFYSLIAAQHQPTPARERVEPDARWIVGGAGQGQGGHGNGAGRAWHPAGAGPARWWLGRSTGRG